MIQQHDGTKRCRLAALNSQKSLAWWQVLREQSLVKTHVAYDACRTSTKLSMQWFVMMLKAMAWLLSHMRGAPAGIMSTGTHAMRAPLAKDTAAGTAAAETLLSANREAHKARFLGLKCNSHYRMTWLFIFVWAHDVGLWKHL